MLQERIDLLYEAQLMSQETYEDLPKLIARVEGFLGKALNDENAGSFITHLIKAIERTKGGTPVDESPDVLMEQALLKKNLFDFGLELLSPYNAQGLNLEHEAVFITSYFEMILEEDI